MVSVCESKSKAGLSRSKQLLLVCALLVPVWCAWVGFNGIVSVPGWLMLSIVYIFDVPPTSSIFATWGRVMDLSSRFLISEKDWNITEYTLAEGEEFSYALLKRLSRKFTRPVIFRGLAKDLEVMKLWSTPDYFINTPKYANTDLLVVHNAKVKDQWSAAQNATTYGDTLGNGAYKIRRAKLGDALKRMKRGEDLYVQNVDNLARVHPEMAKALKFDSIIPNWKSSKEFVPPFINWFMGFGSKDFSETTGTSMHAAWVANMFYVFAGKKQWTWVEGRWAPFLLAEYQKHITACFVRRLPDYIPRATAIIYAGDVMYNPPWIFHEVRNFEGWTMAAANRVVFAWAAMKEVPLVQLLFDTFADHKKMTDPKMHQHYRFPAIHNFVMTTPVIRTLALLFGAGDGMVQQGGDKNFCDEHSRGPCLSSYDEILFKTTELEQ